MVIYLFLLAHWLSLLYTTISYLPIGCLEHSYLLLAHWPFLLYTPIFLFPTGPHMSLWYTAIFYRPTDYLFGTLPSSSCLLAVSMIHYYLLVAHWLSLWYTTILLLAHWLSLWCTTIFYWPTGPLYANLPSSIGQRALSMVHYHLLLAQWPLPM